MMASTKLGELFKMQFDAVSNHMKVLATNTTQEVTKPFRMPKIDEAQLVGDFLDWLLTNKYLREWVGAVEDLDNIQRRYFEERDE
jgi:hypothetical protein